MAVFAKVLKVLLHVLSLHRLYPVALPLSILGGAKGNDIHNLAFCNRKDERMALFAQKHVAILRLFLSNRRNGLFHRNQAPIRILSREDGLRQRILLAQHKVPAHGADAIAPDDGVGLVRDAVGKLHDGPPARLVPREANQTLAKLGTLLGHETGQLVNQVRAVGGAVPLVRPELRRGDGRARRLAVEVLAEDEVKVGLLLGRPAGRGRDAGVGVTDGGVDEGHGADGVCAKKDAGCGKLGVQVRFTTYNPIEYQLTPNLKKLRRSFKDAHVNVAVLL